MRLFVAVRMPLVVVAVLATQAFHPSFVDAQKCCSFPPLGFALHQSDLTGHASNTIVLLMSGGNSSNEMTFGAYIHDPDPTRQRWHHGYPKKAFKIANSGSSPPGVRWNWYDCGSNQMSAYGGTGQLFPPSPRSKNGGVCSAKNLVVHDRKRRSKKKHLHLRRRGRKSLQGPLSVV